MTVLQTWLEQIPIRMQSTLLLSLRGPDTHCCPEIKKVQRWMRGLVFRPGNPDNVREFMNHIDGVPELKEKGPLARELEFCTQHFYSHLMHGLEVIGYCHPDRHGIRRKAFELYAGMCDLMHLPIERSGAFEDRLRQMIWPGGGQPEDFADAIGMMSVADVPRES